MSSLQNNLFDLEGHTAIVAGGAGVIGTAMAGTLLGAGANVAVWSRSRGSIDRALEKLAAETGAPNAWTDFRWIPATRKPSRKPCSSRPVDLRPRVF
jgi:NAD(P)-dependent dehydrogenase (short-subunit alcohol dehydrogenase family)